MKERLVLMYLVGLCLIGITIYLFTSVVPTAKFHVFDVGTYGPTEDARYVRTVLELSENVSNIFPELDNWSYVPCSLEYTRSLEALNPIDLVCYTYRSDPDLETLAPTETVWFLTIYGNQSESFHSMESCYLYFGWKIKERSSEQIDIVRSGLYPINMSVFVKRILIERESEKRVVLYWLLYKSPYKDAREGTFLFRVSSPVTTDVHTTNANLEMFAGDVLGNLFITDDVQDTVFEYYSRELGVTFYLMIAIIYLVMALLIAKPDLVLREDEDE